jgi:hypothetical protein
MIFDTVKTLSKKVLTVGQAEAGFVDVSELCRCRVRGDEHCHLARLGAVTGGDGIHFCFCFSLSRILNKK